MSPILQTVCVCVEKGGCQVVSIAANSTESCAVAAAEVFFRCGWSLMKCDYGLEMSC